MVSSLKHPKQKSIAVLIPYFGTLPWYFNYFVHSCKYNLSVHFFIITDDISDKCDLPENIFLIHKTFEEMKSLIDRKLQLAAAIDRPYKLCDFKPAYGVIFSDIIKDYDFWGHGDIDIIFGNIRNFITDEILGEYDVISLRHDFITGYFQLFKNTEKINKLFTLSKDYKKVFTNSQHFCFDETNFRFNEFTAGLHYSTIGSEIESMTHLIKKLHEQNSIKAHFDFYVIEGTPGKLKWNNGVLLYKNKFEVILYHLIKLKTLYIPKKIPKKIPCLFHISPSKIYS